MFLFHFVLFLKKIKLSSFVLNVLFLNFIFKSFCPNFLRGKNTLFGGMAGPHILPKAKTGTGRSLWRFPTNAGERDRSAPDNADWTGRPCRPCPCPPLPLDALPLPLSPSHATRGPARPGPTPRGPRWPAAGADAAVLVPRAPHRVRAPRPATAAPCQVRISSSVWIGGALAESHPGWPRLA